MGRKSNCNYVEVARDILSGVEGGTLRSKELVAIALERGLITDGKWSYHAMLRFVRESDEFDTSERGHVTLGGPGTGPVTEETVTAPPAPQVESFGTGDTETDEPVETLEIGSTEPTETI